MKRFIFCIFLFFSCNDFLDADLDKSLIVEEKIFSNDVTATAAVIGMYNSISDGSPLSGIPNGMGALTSLSAGELWNYPQNSDLKAFQSHQILASNSNVSLLWNFMYNVIYQCNAILEGIQKSHSLSAGASRQLEGEARFMRAFIYF